MKTNVLIAILLVVGAVFVYKYVNDWNVDVDGKEAKEQVAGTAQEKVEKIKEQVTNNENNKNMDLKIETTQEGTGDKVTKAGDTISVH